MSWRLKLSDWLSGGLLKKYQRQAESTKAQLRQAELDIDNLKKQLLGLQRELEQAQAQLLIAKGFQQELGETQLRFEQTSTKLYQCQQQLQQKQQELEQALTKSVASVDEHQQAQTIREVSEVKRLPQEDFDALWGFSIASPQAQMKIEGDSMILRGWVLGKKAMVTAVKINCQGQTLVEIPVNLSSPNVTQYYPDISAAGKCGFETALSIVSMPSKAQLEVQAVLENEDIIALGIIGLT